jgi:hypothetical protein
MPLASPVVGPWRPWLALAAVHLMAHGDTAVREAQLGTGDTAARGVRVRRHAAQARPTP